jgi:hypothetical protein
MLGYRFEQINCENYNEETSLRLIIVLLNHSKLSLHDFNKFAYPSIDISELYDLDLKRIKEYKKKEFKQVLETAKDVTNGTFGDLPS